MKTESWDKYLERNDGELPAPETPAVVTESYADYVKRAPEPQPEGAEAEAAAAAEAESADESPEPAKKQQGSRKKTTGD